MAETLLAFSPLVYYRAPGLAFADITATSQLLGGDQKVLMRALEIGREFDHDVVGAIADTPWGAQVASSEKPNVISLPRRENDLLDQAPLSRLHDLEGLIPWHSTTQVEKIVDFFYLIGVRTLRELRHFGVEAFRDRWGETGELIWKRLRNADRQIISPLSVSDSLEDYVHLDFPVGQLDLLLRHLEGSLRRLLARLAGRGEYATQITLRLFCEYSGRVHTHELRPATPGRDFDLFMKLLDHKLARIDLDNPVQQIAIAVSTCPERVQQLSFFEPRVSDVDKLSQLVSVFQQADLTSGFLRPRDELLPEKSWGVTAEFEPYDPIDDEIESRGESFQVRPAYARGLLRAPRPSRLLRAPRALLDREFGKYQLLSHQPIERIEDSWWDDIQGRDYFFARSAEGEFVWLFFDRADRTYYLHGYFD